jgi:hypothetical protein
MEYNIQLSIPAYADLVRCLNHYVRRLKPNERNNGSKKKIFEEFGTIKKPGKKIRKSLVKKRRKNFELRTQNFTVKFLEITGTVFPGEKQYGSVISLNRARVFMLKFFNNILGINTRLSHFVQNHSRGCTFCQLAAVNPVPDETFSHLFLDCNTVRKWHDGFLADYFPNGYVRDELDRKTIFFLGRVHEPDSDNFFIGFTILLFQYHIWELRLKKRAPSYHSIKQELEVTVRNLLRGNSLARKEILKTNFILCRKLRNGEEHRPGFQPVRAAALPRGGNE